MKGFPFPLVLVSAQEHVRNWSGYDPAAREGTMSLRDWVHVFSVSLASSIVGSGWSRITFSRPGTYVRGCLKQLAQLGKVGPPWGTPPASP